MMKAKAMIKAKAKAMIKAKAKLYLPYPSGALLQ